MCVGPPNVRAPLTDTHAAFQTITAQADLSAQHARTTVGPQSPVPALGGQGPDAATLGAYNHGDQTLRACSVGPNSQHTGVHRQTDRLLVADLTSLHEAHKQEDETRPPGAPVPFGRPVHVTDPGGYHSDVYCNEVYQLLIGALFS